MENAWARLFVDRGKAGDATDKAEPKYHALTTPNKRSDNKNRTPTSPSSIACICGLSVYSNLRSYISRISIHLKEVRKS